MTTYKGIAAVTQTLGYLVSASIRDAVPEARVTLARPEEPAAGSANEPRVNIYLVQVRPEATMRSNDLPTRDDRGNLISVPRAPVNLRYLLSFFGSWDKALVMLGATELALRERAVLDSTLIRQALESHPALVDSGLDEQLPPVRLVPSSVTLEELSRFWSGFLQMPYTVSTVYDATTVVLSSSQAAGVALPVLAVGRNVGGPPPQLDALPTVQFSADAPGTAVPVTGSGLAAGQQVEVSGRWLALDPRPAVGFRFTLPDDAAAGSQVVRLGAIGEGGAPRAIPGSLPQTLRVRPELRQVSLDETGGAVTVTVAPPVRPGQQAVLSLVATTPGGDPAGSSAQISTIPVAASTQLTFQVPPRLPSGPYLALVDIDGVTSLPAIADGRFARPIVELDR